MSSYVDILCRQSSIGILEFAALGPGLQTIFTEYLNTDSFLLNRSTACSSRSTASLPFLAVCLGRWICPDYDNYDNGLPCSLPPYPFCLAPLQMEIHLKMYTSWQKKKWGKGPLELNWTSGKNMDRYLQRTICRSCSGGDRDVTMVSAFCGPGREWLLKSDETAPDPNGSRKCSHPRTTDHSTVNTQVPA